MIKARRIHDLPKIPYECLTYESRLKNQREAIDHVYEWLRSLFGDRASKHRSAFIDFVALDKTPVFYIMEDGKVHRNCTYVLREYNKMVR